MGACQNPSRLGKLSVEDRNGHLSCREFLAAGAATAVNDSTSVFGFHALAESAVLLTLFFARLICAFHRKIPLIKFAAQILPDQSKKEKLKNFI